jgi:sensor histidine kinase regulating citrate/malate metabolism
MKHDIGIHLDVIQSLATAGNMDNLMTYIDSYHHALAHTHHLLSTGNTAIDCILSSKIDTAKKLNIKTDFSVLVPQAFPIDALSLSSLLGNMWNNALEACQRLQNAKPNIQPYIHFYIKPFRHMIIIHMENNYDQIIQKDDIYLSMKKDNFHGKGNFHGIGLKRITDIVDEAEGIFQTNADNHVFTIHIMIPQKEDANEANNFNS